MITLAATGGTSIQLQNPVLGDSEQLDIHTKFMLTMDALVYSTKRTKTHSVFLLNFIDVKQDKIDEFEIWYMANRGRLITYTDYKSATHVGMITNNPLEVSRTGRKECNGSGDSSIEVGSFTIEFKAQNS